MKRFPASSSGRARSARAASVLWLWAAVAGCGDRNIAEPRWESLARDFRPRPLLEIASGWNAGSAVTARADEAESGRIWLEIALPGGGWRPHDEVEGLFQADYPREGGFLHAPPGPIRLAAGEHSFTRVASESGLVPGTFHVTGDRILLLLPPGEAPPAATTLAIRVGNGRDVDGAWRVYGRNRAAAGIPVWSGEREEVVRDVPARSCLRLLVTHDAPDLVPRPSFRILLNGEPILDHRPLANEEWHRIELPEAGLSRARFTFEVEGAPGVGLFCDPVIGPADAGHYGERPWRGARPNVVLVIADTFRADNMALYGGKADLTPRLDRLAARSVRFLDARATAAWTLPSTASLFTGLLPGQHGATKKDRALSGKLTTIAEAFAAAGYRTGAITDASFVSITYGLDQGFDWFSEHPWGTWDLDRTLEEALAFLDRDDGRPVFLLVHTYRVHAPYREGPDEDDSRWRALVDEGLERVRELRERGDLPRGKRRELLLETVGPLRRLYEEGVRAFDEGMGTLLDGIEARELGGYLVFTSDHGEAFGENKDIYHGGKLWDVKLRVPLLIHGSGLEPRDVAWPVSLVDVPPTLAALAGLPARSDWVGEPLLELVGTRPVLSFRLENKRELAIVERDHKVLALPDADALRRGEFTAAFDLASDPGEENALSADDAPWARELCRRLADEVERSLDPQAATVRTELDAEAREQLKAIGYGGS